MPTIRDFATWEPLLALMWAANRGNLPASGTRVTGSIDRYGWNVLLPVRRPELGRPAQVEDMRAEFDAAGRVQAALADAGVTGISFIAEFGPTGATVLHLIEPNPAVQPGVGSYLGALLLVEGAVAEPWRRRPDPVPQATVSPSANPALLERTLRGRIPDGVGATDAEITAAQARLGVPLPDELRALYRVTRADRADWREHPDAAQRVVGAVGCELLPLGEVYVADPASRPAPWKFAAGEVVVTPPDAAVQGLVGSPGWIAFGDNGGGDRLAVDLTPGPTGHIGQIIMLSHEEYTGGMLVAPSLTDMIVNRHVDPRPAAPTDTPPAVARVNASSLTSVEAAVHPALEVLSIGVWDGPPHSLAPVVGLPRLRTLSAYPGTLADPREIAGLTGLEYLELALPQWRVLLDADAVPPGLLAAGIEKRADTDPLAVIALANELLARWHRPQITTTVVVPHPPR